MSRTAANNNSTDCEEFPLDDAGKRPLVKELFDAMVNCDKALENMTHLWEGGEYELYTDETPRQIAKVKNTPHTLLEMMVWQLLIAIGDAQAGNITRAPTGKDALAITPYPTSRQRLDKVKLASLNRKVFIDHIREDRYALKLAGAPEKSL